MSNNIGSFSPGSFNPYHRVQNDASATPPSAPEDSRVQQGSETAAPASAQESQAATDTPSLSKEEAAMIQREFPTNSDLSMRLYGRNRGTQNVAPDTLGHNLDVRG